MHILTTNTAPSLPNAVRGLIDVVFRIFYDQINTSVYHKREEEILTEYNIIKKCQDNPEHFAPLYRKYYDQIFMFTFKRVDHLEIAADITSRVFLKCLKNIGKYKYQGVPFSAWLHKIAINEVNMFFRQQSKMERTVSLDHQDMRQLFDEIDYQEVQIDPEVLITVLLEQLDEKEIQFIELRFFESRSFKEIGYLLGISETNAKVKTYRILKKLKKVSKQVNYNN
ncbi:sigma-70 family RNA polymerase sigma factor [Fulvivirga sp. 29W222]|uniref:Sigma-70 family RNA polymerase sigma factor n=1 Tax=Fulvivirga marina TaxID=2494733 RepID=A0A937FUI3_9BACT|nr:sigma-70 family RNA polymerase sigma factor [Fulvivirga marina]MBL6445228.1 sigma-70 family RNA polymerase sigma factor [Fulvivirga marina]